MIVYFIIIGYLFIGMCTSIGCMLHDYQLSSAKNIDIYLEWKDSEDFLQYVVMGIFWPMTLVIIFITTLLPFIFKKLVIAFVLCLMSIIFKHEIKKMMRKEKGEIKHE